MARLSPARLLPGWQPDPPGTGSAAGPGASGEAQRHGGSGQGTGGTGGGGPWRRRRRRIPLRLKWTAAVVVVGLVFRRAIAAAVLVALSAALHLVGVSVHLPRIKFAWPWQSISSGYGSDTSLGPWVLQKVQGISRPAVATANVDFLFTHKVSKSLGPWPCWYASTFYAVARVPATVDLNPGPSWWAPGSGHYQLQIKSRPAAGKPGHVTVMMVLPRPQLPQSVHDVTIDNIPSKPVDTQHSWTYPGVGCGVVLHPQFPQSVLYAQAQNIAFYRANHVPQVTQPLVATAESQARQTVRDNFIQPTVNALGYRLDQFTVHWVASP